jgi:hypothetical protein
MQISYSNIFKIAWQITVKNKILWIFGLFASFISLESVYEVIIGKINQIRNVEEFQQAISNLTSDQFNFLNQQFFLLNLSSQNYYRSLIFVLVAFLFLFLLWLIFTSQIFIIKSASSIYHTRKISFLKIFSHSNDKFWSVFSINILSKLILYTCFIALNLPLLSLILFQKYYLTISASIIYFLIYIFLAIIISFITAYATNFIIVKNLSILESIKEAWLLFSANITLSLEIAFILFCIKFLSLILVLCSFLLLLIPMMILLLISIVNNSLLGFIMSVTLIILALLLTLALVSSLYTVFYLCTWTITFTKLTEESFLSKTVYFMQNMLARFKNIAGKLGFKIDKNKIKKQAKILAKKTKIEAEIVGNKLAEKYIEYKPIVEKQSKIWYKKSHQSYLKAKPKVKKAINDLLNPKVKRTKGKKKK